MDIESLQVLCGAYGRGLQWSPSEFGHCIYPYIRALYLSIYNDGQAVTEKVRMVEQTFEPGMTVSLVARRHGVAPNQLFTWAPIGGARQPDGRRQRSLAQALANVTSAHHHMGPVLGSVRYPGPSQKPNAQRGPSD